jgi:hypothetical protein
LVDYVEVELAWWHLAWADEEERAKYKMPWWAVGWWRVRTWRCPEAGLANLEWQRNLRWKEDDGFAEGDKNIGTLTHQAKAAQEILDLYKWWTEVYPARQDPMDASGWSEYCERKRVLAEEHGMSTFSGMFSDRHETKELKKFGARALKLSTKIENKYKKEDEEMMIRLIKIRESLWT